MSLDAGAGLAPSRPRCPAPHANLENYSGGGRGEGRRRAGQKVPDEDFSESREAFGVL